ncbi:MAG: MarR family transcriptional regulator [Gammaproteobacteria bacterium]|nr:MAG: MarR family transcriptional regulator [Gammaproteobacteria bacterium]
MTDEQNNPTNESIAVWTKRCYFAGRALMDSTLRSYDLGSTQWYVLWQLANDGPTIQRDLVRMLYIERATLSGIVATLVRKGLISQVPDYADQRQRLLQLTSSGKKLWDELPDLTFIHKVAFDGIDDDAIATAIMVLKTATEQIDNFSQEGVKK